MRKLLTAALFRNVVGSTSLKQTSTSCASLNRASYASSSHHGDSPNSDYKISPVYHNRNPRNLEKLSLARKRLGWTFQLPRRDYYHKLIFDPTNRHTEGRVEHFSGEVVVSASTKEWAIRNQLYSCSDVSASENIGRILAQRCLESGITSVFFDEDEVDTNSMKVSVFTKAFQDHQISLSEPDTIEPENRPGIDYDGYNRYAEPKHWKDDYQEG